MKRYVIKIYGIVQGVGFESFVYHQAKVHQLKGFVKNCGDYVLLDCEGERENICTFLLEAIKKPSPLWNIEKIRAYLLVTWDYTQFSIIGEV